MANRLLRERALSSFPPYLGAAEEFCADPFDQEGQLCHVDSEIQRGIGLQKWLENTDPGHFIRSGKPRTEDPLISVIVPMYNACEWVETMLKSLLLQKENIEIFCVDDASTDDTHERVQRLFGDDGRVCLVRLQKNVGPYQIRNWVAAKLARGELLAFQDADDFSHPNRLQMQRECLQRRGAVACGTNVFQIFPACIKPVRGDSAKWESGGFLHDLVFYSDVPRMTDARPIRSMLSRRAPSLFQRNGTRVEQIPTSESPACYPTLVIKRRTFLQFGGFNGHTSIHADKAFVYRLVRFHDVVNVPAILYGRRIHSQSLTQRPETGYASALRLDQDSAMLENDRNICKALEKGRHEEVTRLATSDLYHADVRVADVHAQFALPGL